jgi:hypothetical protein
MMPDSGSHPLARQSERDGSAKGRQAAATVAEHDGTLWRAADREIAQLADELAQVDATDGERTSGLLYSLHAAITRYFDEAELMVASDVEYRGRPWELSAVHVFS